MGDAVRACPEGFKGFATTHSYDCIQELGSLIRNCPDLHDQQKHAWRRRHGRHREDQTPAHVGPPAAREATTMPLPGVVEIEVDAVIRCLALPLAAGVLDA